MVRTGPAPLVDRVLFVADCMIFFAFAMFSG
jgi:hypothetical protein